MPFLALPNELILLIASTLPKKDLSSLTLTNHRLSNLLTPTLNTLATQDHKALFWAVRQDRPDLVSKFLCLGVDIDITDPDNETALHKAVASSNEPIVKLLLENGAGLEIVNTSYKETPLLKAAAGRSEEIVRMLVEAGADVNASNLDEKSVLAVVYAWMGLVSREQWWEARVGLLLGGRGATWRA